MPRIGSKVTKNTEIRNDTGIVHVTGDSYTEGSHQFEVDGDSGIVAIKVLTEDIWQPDSIQIATESLWIGLNVGLAATGCHLSARISPTHFHLYPHSEFDSEVSTGDASSPYVYDYVARVVFQPDESGEILGTILERTAVPTNHVLIHNSYYKVGTTAPTEPVTIETWEGTDDTGLPVFKQTYPASKFPAETEITLDRKGLIEYKPGVTYFIRISSVV